INRTGTSATQTYHAKKAEETQRREKKRGEAGRIPLREIRPTTSQGRLGTQSAFFMSAQLLLKKLA
ncbi:hypothetical protein Q5H93_22960, partial [Hymenobacter sp. ASUV-10]